MRNLALLYIDACRYQEAIAMADSGIELTPQADELYHIKGESLLMLGRSGEALEMWKKVLEINPNFLNSHPEGTNLSNGLKKLGLIE